MNDPKHAETFAIIAASLALLGFFLIGAWDPELGFLANLIHAKVDLGGSSLPFRWVLLVSAGLLAWAAYLKYVRGRHPN
jgi:hypothetical protein